MSTITETDHTRITLIPKTSQEVRFYEYWSNIDRNVLLCPFPKDLIQPKWKHKVLLQNDSSELDHCCFIITSDSLKLRFILNNLYHWKLDSFTLSLPLESFKTELRFESYGRLKIGCFLPPGYGVTMPKKAYFRPWNSTTSWPLKKAQKCVFSSKSTYQTSKSKLEHYHNTFWV